MKQKIDQIIEDLKQNSYICGKYDQKWGIYCIKINNIIVYIGKSKDMLRRIANHQFYTLYPNPKEGKKYLYLNAAHKMNIQIQFDVLSYSPTGDLDNLGELEAVYINQYKPILNTQIPKIGNYRSYSINSETKNLTVEKFLKICGQKL